MDQYAPNKSKRKPLNVHESRRNLSNEEAGGHQLEDCCISALPSHHYFQRTQTWNATEHGWSWTEVRAEQPIGQNRRIARDFIRFACVRNLSTGYWNSLTSKIVYRNLCRLCPEAQAVPCVRNDPHPNTLQWDLDRNPGCLCHWTSGSIEADNFSISLYTIPQHTRI